MSNTITATLTAKVGGEVKATLSKSISTESPDTSVLHECHNCIDGTISAKLSLSFEVKFLNSENRKLNFDLLNITIKIADFYFSLDFADSGFTTCPHKQYRVDVLVVDRNHQPVQNAYVNDKGQTDDKGKLSFYLSNGTYTIVAVKDGSSSARIFTV